MIVILCGLNHGGILQYADKLASTLEELSISYRLFLPMGADQTCLHTSADKIVEYAFHKNLIFAHKSAMAVSKKIDALTPDLLFATDDALATEMMLVSCHLADKTFCVLHDVTPHMQAFRLKMYAVETVKNLYRKKMLSRLDKVLLLSKHSYSIFCERYGKQRKKAVLFPLGSHVPETVCVRPAEISNFSEQQYILFFGRIDLYKGIDLLLDAFSFYRSKGEKNYTLVVAGKPVAGYEFPEIKNPENIVRLDRYISDGEMRWLFRHCKAVVLPYREASQSGVLPIAYSFGKPVIASSVPGLTEFIVPGETGWICASLEEFAAAINSLDDEKLYKNMRECSLNYHRSHFDWKTNVSKLFAENGIIGSTLEVNDAHK